MMCFLKWGDGVQDRGVVSNKCVGQLHSFAFEEFSCNNVP